MNSNLEQDAQKVISALKTTRNAAQIGSAVTSVMIIWIIAFSKAQEFLPAWGAGLLAVFIVGLALGVMELGLRIFLPFALDEILAGRAWNEKGRVKAAYRVTFWLFCLALCAALALGTGGTSWLGRIDMIEAATPPPQVADLNQVRQDQDAERNRIHLSYQDQINSATKTHAKRVKDAQKSAKQMLEDAKHSKGEKMYQLYVSGNGWAETQLASAIKKAESAGQSLIDSEKNKVKELTAMQATTLSSLSSDQKEVFGKISQQTETTISRFDNKFDRNTLMIGVFGVGCLGLFILTNILLSIYRVLSGVPTFEDKPQERRQFSLNMNWVPTFGGQSKPTPTASARPIGLRVYGEEKKTTDPGSDGISGKATTFQEGNMGAESGNISPNVTTPEQSYHQSAGGSFSGKVTDREPPQPKEVEVQHIPDNTNKSYSKRKDVKARERLIATTFFAYKEENGGKKPTMQTLSKITGIGYKTTRKIAHDLGLK